MLYRSQSIALSIRACWLFKSTHEITIISTFIILMGLGFQARDAEAQYSFMSSEVVLPHPVHVRDSFESWFDFTSSSFNGFDPVLVPFSICDSLDDFVDISIYSGQFGIPRELALQRAEATVFIRTKRSQDSTLIASMSPLANIAWCSGTLISSNRILTAGHCLSSRATAEAERISGSNRNITKSDLLSMLQVVFNYSSTTTTMPGAILVSNIVSADVIEDNGMRDYAIFTVEDSVSSHFTPLTKFRPSIIFGEELSIIQHPGKVPKVIAGGRVTSKPLDSTLQYEISTNKVSSGAGVLDSDGYLVGVHIGAGCTGGGSNRGMPVTFALDNIEQ